MRLVRWAVLASVAVIVCGAAYSFRNEVAHKLGLSATANAAEQGSCSPAASAQPQGGAGGPIRPAPFRSSPSPSTAKPMPILVEAVGTVQAIRPRSRSSRASTAPCLRPRPGSASAWRCADGDDRNGAAGSARPRRPWGCAEAAGLELLALRHLRSSGRACAPPRYGTSRPRHKQSLPLKRGPPNGPSASRTPKNPSPCPDYRRAMPARTVTTGCSRHFSMQKTRREGGLESEICGLLRLSAVIFDDQGRLHLDRVGHVGQLRAAHEGALHVLVVGRDVFRHVALGGLGQLRGPAPSPWPWTCSSMTSLSLTR